MPTNSATKLDYKKYTILIVDDTPTNIGVVTDYLADYGFEILIARDGEKALQRSRYTRPDLILLDVMMPGIDGFGTCRRLKADEVTKDIPVIFMTALANPEDKVRGFEVGGVDYVTKPLHQEEVLARITTHLRIRDLTLSLQKANKQLADLNASKDKFFSMIAQDLHDPFNTLLDNLHLILTDADRLPPAELRQMAEQSYAAGGTIHSLVETLMTWSSLQRTHLKCESDEINLRDVARQAVEVWQNTAHRKNIELTNDIEEDIMLCADRMMLTTIIRNLLANALKYTLNGGWIKLSVQPASSGQEQEADRFVEVVVTDAGIGINQENIAKLFKLDASYTTPGIAQERGAGLGLILCKEMVEHNGGQIRIESTPGRGTTVSFTVPPAGLGGCNSPKNS